MLQPLTEATRNFEAETPAPWHLQSTFVSKLSAVLASGAWALSTIVTKIMNRQNRFNLVLLTVWQRLLD